MESVVVVESLCAHPGCYKPAKAVWNGRWLCGNHHHYARDAAERLREDAVAHVEILIDNYLPEMRDQDAGMLRRIAEREDELETSFEMRLHLAARKMAAQRVLAEREIDGACVVA